MHQTSRGAKGQCRCAPCVLSLSNERLLSRLSDLAREPSRVPKSPQLISYYPDKNPISYEEWPGVAAYDASKRDCVAYWPEFAPYRQHGQPVEQSDGGHILPHGGH